MKLEKAHINFPFLGSTEDGEPFEYLLISLTADFVEIAIYEWFVNRTKLHKGSKVDLHIPKILDENRILTKLELDKVISVKNANEMKGEIYQISYVNSSHLKQAVLKEESNTLDTLLTPDFITSLIKDTLILKHGVSIYLKHLIPYFSRITNYKEQEYEKLNEIFLKDIEQHIKSNKEKIQKLYDTLTKELKDIEQVPIFINLEDLRELFESEISLTLFRLVFGEQKQLSEKAYKTEFTYGIANYINAIKNLEKRLYSNYNLIVLIYSKSL